MGNKQHHITIIGQERPFDAERWQQLLTAFAYVLHEQRQAEVATDGAEEPAVTLHNPTTHPTPTSAAREGEAG